MVQFILLIFVIPMCFAYITSSFKKVENIVSFCALTILLHDFIIVLTLSKSIFSFSELTSSFYILYTLICFVCTFISYVLYRMSMKRNGFYVHYKSTFLSAIIVVFVFLYFQWFLALNGRMDFALLMYNIYTPLSLTGDTAYLYIAMLIILMLLMSLCVCIIWFKKQLIQKIKRKEQPDSLYFSCFILPIVLSLISVGYPIYTFHLEQAYDYFYSESDFIQKNYVNPNSTNITWPEKKRNLIYIFLESFESSYFPKEFGGLDNENLLPNLTMLMEEGISFSNKEEPLFGGLRPLPSERTTLAGLGAYLGGIPYKVPGALQADDTYAVVPSVTTLTDLLVAQGYSTYFTQGAPSEDHHIGAYFNAHGVEAVGYKQRIARGDIPSDYFVWWGLEDKKLLEFAQNDIERLANQDAPFFFSLISNDTHSLEGYVDPICPVTSYEYPMQNAIACNDYQIGKFLFWIMDQPFYENTTVVVVGDHSAHVDAYSDTLAPNNERRIFNLILNGDSPYTNATTFDREAWPGDFFPTVLSSLGVNIEGDRLGLGVNLFSDIQTLLERYSDTYFVEEIQKNSKFYVDTFLIPKEK